ncbi:hypothetical protein PSPO01_06049 [Paraphaeosphaeria sporulosa]
MFAGAHELLKVSLCEYDFFVRNGFDLVPGKKRPTRAPVHERNGAMDPRAGRGPTAHCDVAGNRGIRGDHREEVAPWLPDGGGASTQGRPALAMHDETKQDILATSSVAMAA